MHKTPTESDKQVLFDLIDTQAPPERWLQHASQLRDEGQDSRACALVEASLANFGLDTARTLLVALYRRPFEQLGHPFAKARQHPSQDPRRAELAPGSAHCTIPTDQGWAVFETSSPLPCFEWTGTERLYASFLAAWALGVARGAQLYVTTPKGEGLHLVHTFDREIKALKGLDRHFALVNLAARGLGSDDLHLVHLHSGQVFEMPNIALSFDGDTTRWSDGFACCGSGIQKSEVRFVRRDGGWKTRFAHVSNVRTLTPGPERDTLSVDREGQLLRWHAEREKVRDDRRLPESSSNWLLRSPTRMFCTPTLQIALTHPEEGTLFIPHLGDGAPTLRAGLRSAPMGCSTVAPFESTEGWYWLDATRGQLSEPWRLPWALATRDELVALPYVAPLVLDRVLQAAAEGAPIAELLVREGWDFGLRAPSDL